MICKDFNHLFSSGRYSLTYVSKLSGAPVSTIKRLKDNFPSGATGILTKVSDSLRRAVIVSPDGVTLGPQKPPIGCWSSLEEYRESMPGTLQDWTDRIGFKAYQSLRTAEKNWPNMNIKTAEKIAKGYGVTLIFVMPGVGYIDDPLNPCL